MPGSEYQPAHRDCKYLFPGLPVIIPPYMYELNIPLVDFREDNGPLEVWPHSHLFHDLKLGDPTTVTSTFNTTTKTEIQQYADDLEPRCVLMPAGSFLLRDPRMWHRGTPNRSDAPRPMLSISYHRPWYRFNSVSVSRDIYDAWPERLQAIFRLACIDGVHSTEFG
jgi:ectoine hydroxylase-related dioxygenase (phytanoyl-CoA dioxygenase family)